MRIAFRVDASSAIGTGHVYRCLGLADELKARDHRIVFLCRELPGNLIDLVRRRGFECAVLPQEASADEDAGLTVAALSRTKNDMDWLVVDHYGLDATWEAAVRGRARRLFAIDDLADRPHDTEVLLDASQDEDDVGRYRGLVPGHTRLLLGPGYIPLRREFFDRPQVPRRPRPVRRIMVTFGGNDPLNMTGLALRAFDEPEFSNIAFDVTAGTSNPRLAQIEKLASTMANVALHVQHPQPSVLMEQADLCVGAGGTTSWERCYLGLPSLVAVLADNQKEITERLDRLGVARSLGDGSKLTIGSLRAAIKSAIQDRAWQMASSRAGQALVDGGGIGRMIEVIEHMDGPRGV
jgi:UDP-2,4-diacetamido-2,4,6-trideoxy-beta-L-altropyranose hydrolase